MWWAALREHVVPHLFPPLLHVTLSFDTLALGIDAYFGFACNINLYP